MAVTREAVLHVARLAQLTLDEPEVDRMVQNLRRILDYVDELGALPTSEVPPTASVAVSEAPFRPDEPLAGTATDAALREAPRSAEGAFAVPGFVDE